MEVIDSADIKYYITMWSVYNVDRNELNLRVEFDLRANILSTDTVTFTISFTTDITVENRYLETFAEDAGQCKATINTDDDTFWDFEAIDTFYSCNPTADESKCEQYGYTAGSGESTSFYNWSVSYVDDNEGDPMCTPHS